MSIQLFLFIVQLQFNNGQYQIYFLYFEVGYHNELIFGNLPFCRFALAKAIRAQLLLDGQNSLDVDQNWITSALCQVFKDEKGKDPDMYHGEVIQVLDRVSKTYYNIQIQVIKIPAFKIEHATKSKDFLLVYDNKPPSKINHCIFVEKFENAIFYCINSWGSSDPYPEISL